MRPRTSSNGSSWPSMRRFADFADDEDWLALMTALERAPDPGAACLRQMLAWSLRHDAKNDGASACGCATDGERS